MIEGIIQEQYWFWSVTISAISLLISSVITVFVFGMSSRLNKALKIMEISSKSEERISDLRAKLYDQVKGDINQIFVSCYLVGNWRNVDLQAVLKAKRTVDKAMIEALPIWGTEVIAAYLEFVDVCFQTKSGRNTSPRLRGDPNRYSQEHNNLPENWEDFFMACEERSKWISEMLPNELNPSYRTQILRPAFVKLNLSVAASLGVELSEEQVMQLI